MQRFPPSSISLRLGGDWFGKVGHDRTFCITYHGSGAFPSAPKTLKTTEYSRVNGGEDLSEAKHCHKHI